MSEEMIPCACGCGLFRKRYSDCGRERRYLNHHYKTSLRPKVLRRRAHMEIRRGAERGLSTSIEPDKMKEILETAKSAPLKRIGKGYATGPEGPFFSLPEIAFLIKAGALRPVKVPGKFGRGGVAWIAP